MSSSLKSEKSDNILNDSGNGQALMNSAYHNTTVKSKVDFIYGAVPSRSKNDILLVLQSCDYNVEAAISLFSQGRADDVLNQWSHRGKRSKDGNKKKSNKRKPGSVNKQDFESRKEKEKSPGVPQEQQAVNGSAQQAAVQSTPLPGPSKPQVPTNLGLDTSDDGASLKESNVNGISALSSNSSTSSDAITPSDEPAALPNKQKDQSNHSSSHHHRHHKSNKHSHHPKPEKLSPTSGIDALKKTTKDLLRSSFSLGRYHLVLEEECEQSLKRLTKTFANIRSCIDEREATLNKTLKEFQEEAVKLLQQRAEDAAALKLKTERVQSMSEEQIALLRADIKNFVAERKIDEELAQTKRFICDEENFLQGIKTFGEVVPIKSTYTPVVLNHPTPSTRPKPSSAHTQPSPVNHSSENKLSITTRSANVAKSPEALSLPKTPEPQTTPSVTSHQTVVKSGRPPKIESLISSAMAKTSIAVGNIRDAEEIHSKLKEDAEKQDIVSQNEAEKENPSKEPKQTNTRAATASHLSGKQQYKRSQEPRPRRPQTSRQGNRSNSRHNKDEKTSDKLNETSQTDEARAKTSQRASSGPNEKEKDRNTDSRKPTEGTPDSNSPREEGSKRPPRRRRKVKMNGEEAAKDAAGMSTEKESGQSAANEDRQTEKKEERDDKRQEKEAKTENISTDGALPQRSSKNQNRRRFRGREKDNSKEREKQQLNGASNGLANNRAANGEEAEKVGIGGKEEKFAKVNVVVDQPLINGHSEDHNDKTPEKKENRDKINKKENLEINGHATSNGNGDECMVGR